MANSVTTYAAREKFAKAHGEGAALPKIAQMGWGDGGHDVNNQPIPPDPGATIVPGEFLRKPIESYSYPASTTVRFVCRLTTSEGIGKMVSAVGLYDNAGTLVALKTFAPKAKDADTEIEIQWDEQF